MFKFLKKKPKQPEPIIETKPSIKDNLIFAFKDIDGLNYYKFANPDDMPMTRVAPTLRFDIELIKRITDGELEDLLKLLENHLFNAVKDPKALPKCAAIVHEIRLRRDQISDVKTYYNWFAINYIREDEDVNVWNIDIHKQKVEAFKKGSDIQGSFFFALPELKTLCARLNILTEKWEDIMIQSDMVQERNKEALELLK